MFFLKFFKKLLMLNLCLFVLFNINYSVLCNPNKSIVEVLYNLKIQGIITNSVILEYYNHGWYNTINKNVKFDNKLSFTNFELFKLHPFIIWKLSFETTCGKLIFFDYVSNCSTKPWNGLQINNYFHVHSPNMLFKKSEFKDLFGYSNNRNLSYINNCFINSAKHSLINYIITNNFNNGLLSYHNNYINSSHKLF